MTANESAELRELKRRNRLLEQGERGPRSKLVITSEQHGAGTQALASLMQVPRFLLDWFTQQGRAGGQTDSGTTWLECTRLRS